MQRAAVLAALDRAMLGALSRRTTGALRTALPLRAVLPQLEAFLAVNLAKEAAKDTLVIRRAGERHGRGGPPAGAEALRLFELTKDIDREFLARIARMPFRVDIPYARVGPLRVQRIERMLQAAERVLAAWPERGGAREALQAAYSRREFETHLSEVLDLYARETHAVSFSVDLPLLLVPMRYAAAFGLLGLMNAVAAGLVRDIGAAAYGRPLRAARRCGPAITPPA